MLAARGPTGDRAGESAARGVIRRRRVVGRSSSVVRTCDVAHVSLCACARAPQAPSWYSADNTACTSTEVLLLALLVVHVDEDGAAKEWAETVIADVAELDTSAGSRWASPVSWRSASPGAVPNRFRSMLSGSQKAPKQAIANAIAAYDGDGSTEAPVPEGEIVGYLSSLLKDSKDSAVLVGVGAGKTVRKGAPLRRIYIAPRVARLVHDRYDELKSAFDDGHDFVLSRAQQQRPDGLPKAAQTPLKHELKQVLEAATERIEQLEEQLAHEKRRADRALQRAAEQRANVGAAVERRAAAATERAEESARVALAAAVTARDVALERARKAEEENRTLRAARARALARVSDPAALRRKNNELTATRAEMHRLRVAASTHAREIAAARADAQKAREEYGEVKLASRPRGKGAGRGRPHSDSIRQLFQKLLVVCMVHPSQLCEVYASCAESIAPAKCKREGLDLPDDDWCRTLRTEIGAVHESVQSVSLARASRVVDAQWDATPWEQRQFKASVCARAVPSRREIKAETRTLNLTLTVTLNLTRGTSHRQRN